MKKIIYVLGNPLLKKDNLPLKILPLLIKLFPSLSFEIYDPTEEIKVIRQKELVFLDTVAGIIKVTLFNNLDYFKLSPRVSAHDFDLPIQIGLLKKLRKINKVIIIGVPQNGNLVKIIEDIRFYLSTHLTSKK